MSPKCRVWDDHDQLFTHTINNIGNMYSINVLCIKFAPPLNKLIEICHRFNNKYSFKTFLAFFILIHIIISDMSAPEYNYLRSSFELCTTPPHFFPSIIVLKYPIEFDTNKQQPYLRRVRGSHNYWTYRNSFWKRCAAILPSNHTLLVHAIIYRCPHYKKILSKWTMMISFDYQLSPILIYA